MLDAQATLPDDADELKALVLAQRAEIVIRNAEITVREAEIRSRDVLIEKLKQQLAGMRRNRFGASAEALDQFELVLEGEEIAHAAETGPEEPSAATPKRRPRRKPLPGHLPRTEQVIAPDETCQACGGALRPLGEDVTEELEYIPGRFVVRRIVRPKLSCRCCETIHQAALPARPIERGRPGPGLLAHQRGCLPGAYSAQVL